MSLQRHRTAWAGETTQEEHGSSLVVEVLVSGRKELGLAPVSGVAGSGMEMLTSPAERLVCGRALSCVFPGWKSFGSFLRGDTVSTSELEVMPRDWERRNVFRTRRNLCRLPHFALELPGICMLVSSYFMASAAEGSLGDLAPWAGIGASQRIPARLKPEAEFGSRILTTYLGRSSYVSWKCYGPSVLILGTSPVCKVAAGSLSQF